MKPVSVDVSKLLGFRLIAAEASANGQTMTSCANSGLKMGGKDGGKVGDKAGTKGD